MRFAVSFRQPATERIPSTSALQGRSSDRLRRARSHSRNTASGVGLFRSPKSWADRLAVEGGGAARAHRQEPRDAPARAVRPRVDPRRTVLLDRV